MSPPKIRSFDPNGTENNSFEVFSIKFRARALHGDTAYILDLDNDPIEFPLDPGDYPDLVRDNEKIYSDLIAHVSPDLALDLSAGTDGANNGWAAWQQLIESYEPSTPLNLDALTADLYSLRMDKFSSHRHYLTRLAYLSSRLSSGGRPITDDQRRSVFLSGLPNNLEAFALSIYDAPDLPYARVIAKFNAYMARRLARDTGTPQALIGSVVSGSSPCQHACGCRPIKSTSSRSSRRTSIAM